MSNIKWSYMDHWRSAGPAGPIDQWHDRASMSRFLKQIKACGFSGLDTFDFRFWQILGDYGSVANYQEFVQEHGLERIVNTYLTERKTMEPVTLNELMTRLREPGLIILDVRPALEYRQGHITGARSIPIDELESRLHELPRDQEIVAYCRGAYCVFADEAVELLMTRGYQARRMQQGYPDWQFAQLPTETE